MLQLKWKSAFACVLYATIALNAHADEPLFGRLLRDGIELTPEVTATLPAPTFVDSEGKPVSARDSRQALEQLAGPIGVDRFARDSVVAPISVSLDSIDGPDGKRIGHVLNTTFVIHASLDLLNDSDAMKSLSVSSETEETDADETGSASRVTAEELAKRGIDQNPETEAFGRLKFPLLDRVVIEGVGHVQRQSTIDGDADDVVKIAWLLDSRFENTWRPITRDDLGKKVVGDAFPYQGLGGIITVTRMPANPEASVVQSRLVIHEPVAWFNGRNQLRSKLPLIIQDRVRDLRRRLGK